MVTRFRVYRDRNGSFHLQLGGGDDKVFLVVATGRVGSKGVSEGFHFQRNCHSVAFFQHGLTFAKRVKRIHLFGHRR